MHLLLRGTQWFTASNTSVKPVLTYVFCFANRCRATFHISTHTGTINKQMQSACNTNVHVIATNVKSCNSDSTGSSIYNDYLSLSTIAIDSVESKSSSGLNEIQNSCETTVPNQPIYQNSHAIVPGMTFPNNSHISDEISYKSEENMLNEPIHYQKPEAVMIDANLSNDPLLCNDILSQFH
ncbi:unnamed protein product [Schistosoma margrebowiei]|uniref:Uncharacterized protein n=1 Tax=Schistosoma margrebowiei TaxID=48269 RepID=A0A183LYL0_9TREM|nr:unnamed protein product [Schistosoma margrebowiei]